MTLDRQKLSFGVQTNLTEATLFSVKMEGEKENKFMEFRVNSKGQLLAQLNPGNVTFDLGMSVADNNWHRISVTKNQDELIIGDQREKLKGFKLTSELLFGKKKHRLTTVDNY